jgi:predicted metallo-beta-lactamase superfamily hydrolase
MYPNVVFDNIDSSFVEKCFLQAHQGFKDLYANKIILSQKPLGKTNMQAQPVRNLHFWSKKKRAYRITMSNHIKFEQYFKPEELSEEVLVGWFAHELGHVMDYLDRSGWDLIKFAMGYLFFENHRVGTERRADVFAINAGFSDHLVATKQFILEHADLPGFYKQRIKKYYLSIEEVEELRLDKIL